MSYQDETIRIADLMERSGVKFGTSGARGLVSDMQDRVCYAYTLAFLQHLESGGELKAGMQVAIAGDYRPGTPRIMAAVAMAVRSAGCQPVNCGFIPTPAVAAWAMGEGIPSIMVTGSHIPDDRNGIKFYKAAGEILKDDEAGISGSEITIAAGLFDENGSAVEPFEIPELNRAATDAYLDRYLDFFPAGCLSGKKVGVYQHSSVARDVMADLLERLGAEVVRLGRSEAFIPVDTEAIRPEDVALAHDWAAEGAFDALVSADGDGDRPLISDEQGNWLRGDVAGILCARYLGAESVVTPVSSNTAAERCGWFTSVRRTRIGSPFVIAAMDEALAEGVTPVVGYEANGGFLTASDIARGGGMLKALPTRDAVLVPLTILIMAAEKRAPVSALLAELPQRFTYSDRLKNFPAEISRARIASFNNNTAIEAVFGRFGSVKSVDETDGLRITFDSEEVVHLRPSGNAPELRCYNEADSQARAVEMNRICMQIMEGWREP